MFHFFLMKTSFDVRLTVAEIRIQILMQFRINIVTFIVRLIKDYDITNKDNFCNETFLHHT